MGQDPDIGRLLAPRIFHDKLAYLQSIANSCLPSLTELQAQQQTKQETMEPFVCVFDLTASWGSGNSDQGIMGSRNVATLSQYLEITKRFTVWESNDRVQSLVADLEVNPTSIVLVEGMFDTGCSITATMLYSSQGESRYKVKNSAFRLLM